MDEAIDIFPMQVAGTSRGHHDAAGSFGGTSGVNCRTPPGPKTPQTPGITTPSAEERRWTAEGPPNLIAVREGDALPKGYSYDVRAPPNASPAQVASVLNCGDGVDLTKQPDDASHGVGADKGPAKTKAKARRNVARSKNKQALKSYAKEVKDSLAGGRPPCLNVSEDQTHLKSRWQAAAKEIAYKYLDLRKEGWKCYTLFEKTRVHNEVNTAYKFDPPLDPKRIDSYLASHLRSSRAVWKAHWLRYGDHERHHNCPQEAWDGLIKKWPTEACIDQASDMASRRSLVQKPSKNGRKSLMERLDEEVRKNIHYVYGRLGCYRKSMCIVAI
jgi:hypothetical protein